jgi:hypothetical protein
MQLGCVPDQGVPERFSLNDASLNDVSPPMKATGRNLGFLGCRPCGPPGKPKLSSFNPTHGPHQVRPASRIYSPNLVHPNIMSAPPPL